MAKPDQKNKRLNQSDRETLYAFAKKKVAETHDNSAFDAAYENAADVICGTMQDMYPPKDMKVLERYEQARRDACIYYSTGGSNYEQFCFRKDDERIPLRPSDRGCNWRTPFLLEGQAADALAIFRKAEAEAKETLKRRENDFRALIYGAKTFNEVANVWPGAEALRSTIAGEATALSVLSSDVIDRLKADDALLAA
ncbi:MAG: hypothetical protein ABW169_09505 [Sphingobium sp.]